MMVVVSFPVRFVHTPPEGRQGVDSAAVGVESRRGIP